MPAYRQNTRAPRAAAVSAAPAKEEIKPDIDPRTGKKDWSRYNASIVGARWNAAIPLRIPCLGGLAFTATYGVHPVAGIPPAYQPVSFAPQVAWEDDEQGWTHVGRNKKRQAAKRRTRANRILAEED